MRVICTCEKRVKVISESSASASRISQVVLVDTSVNESDLERVLADLQSFPKAQISDVCLTKTTGRASLVGDIEQIQMLQKRKLMIEKNGNALRMWPRIQ